MTNNVQLVIGGKGGKIVIPSFAGLSSAGLYQFNVTIPTGLVIGDLALAALIVGAGPTQSYVVISLQ